MKVKCIRCNREALIIRKHSGERYCKFHFIKKIRKDIIKNITSLDPNRENIFFVPDKRLYIEIFNTIILKYLKKAKLDYILLKLQDPHSPKNISLEVSKIERNYLLILSKTYRSNVILLKTIDELAHDILLLQIYNRHSLLKLLTSNIVKIRKPLFHYMSYEMEQIFNISHPPMCTTEKLLKRISEEKPSIVFSIINFIENFQRTNFKVSN